MKKRSILVSLVVAVLAALTFVGCSDAVAFPQMPQSVKSGYIVQNGDFLVGQAFDASKFSVMVKYDNGGDPVVLQTATVEWKGDEGKGVQNGDVLSAYVGNDSDNMEVYASGTLTAYTIDTIAVTANVTSYTYKEDAEELVKGTEAKALSSMDEIIEKRKKARADKNWDIADKIRVALDKAGIVLKDSKEGTTWELK